MFFRLILKKTLLYKAYQDLALEKYIFNQFKYYLLDLSEVILSSTALVSIYHRCESIEFILILPYFYPIPFLFMCRCNIKLNSFRKYISLVMLEK